MNTTEKENIRLIDLTVFDLKAIVNDCVLNQIEKSNQKQAEKELLTRKEVCKLLSISDNTLNKVMGQGNLKNATIPGSKQIRFKRTDVLSFIELNPDFKYKRKI